MAWRGFALAKIGDQQVKLAKFEPEKHYETGMLANLANFISMVQVGLNCLI